MSNAVLERTKLVIDRPAVMHELLDDIDFISNEGLMEIRAFVGKVLDRECAEYEAHSFDDLPEEVRRDIEAAERGEATGRCMSFEEFYDELAEMGRESRERRRLAGAVPA